MPETSACRDTEKAKHQWCPPMWSSPISYTFKTLLITLDFTQRRRTSVKVLVGSLWPEVKQYMFIITWTPRHHREHSQLILTTSGVLLRVIKVLLKFELWLRYLERKGNKVPSVDYFITQSTSERKKSRPLHFLLSLPENFSSRDSHTLFNYGLTSKAFSDCTV